MGVCVLCIKAPRGKGATRAQGENCARGCEEGAVQNFVGGVHARWVRVLFDLFLPKSVNLGIFPEKHPLVELRVLLIRGQLIWMLWT